MACSAAAIIATLALPAAEPSRGGDEHYQQQRQQHGEDDDNFEWAVTAVVSCIPLVSSVVSS